jgi:hypothetical protein
MKFYLTIILVCFSTFAYAFDRLDYPPNVISVIYKRELSNEQNAAEKNEKDRPVFCIAAGGIPFLAIGRFTGKERPITKNIKRLIRFFSDSLKSDFYKYYENEIEFIDSDQTKHWIPIQTLFHTKFRNEVKEETVALYLIWIGTYTDESCAMSCAIMNEFHAITQ